MSTLKQNIAANFACNIWTGLVMLALVPIYIHFLGVEAYGLMGIFTSLLMIFSLFDMGLSSTLNREMARLAIVKNSAQEMRDLLRTLEIPYWLIAILICVIVIWLSPLIAYHWVNVEDLPLETVETAVMIMGIALAFQWPLGFYLGGLMGLQRQVQLNIINIIMATVRGGGALVVLWLIAPTVEAFFLWQVVVSIIHTGLIVLFLWRNMPPSTEAPHFRIERLLSVWRFAAGMSGITITGLFITQIDKILLTRLLTLENFGYYSMGVSVSAFLQRLIGPFYAALFPRFSELVSMGGELELKALYHKSCQLLAVTILPPAMILIFFSSQVLLLWTGEPLIATRAHLVVALLVIGGALNGIMTIPYVLTLAYGWTTITLYMHFIAIVTLAPMIYFFTTQYGINGAPIGWIIFNLCNIVITIHIIHFRYLKDEKWRWYFQDVVAPLTVSMAVAFTLYVLVPTEHISKICLLFLIGMVSMITLGVTAFTTPYTRFWMSKILHKFIAR